MTESLALAEPEQVLRRKIDEVDDKVRVESDQRNPQTTENAIRTG